MGALAGSALQRERSAGRLDAVFESDEARAARWIGAADAIVADGQPQITVGRGNGDMQDGSLRMLGRVRQCLGDDVIHGHLDALG